MSWPAAAPGGWGARGGSLCRRAALHCRHDGSPNLAAQPQAELAKEKGRVAEVQKLAVVAMGDLQKVATAARKEAAQVKADLEATKAQMQREKERSAIMESGDSELRRQTGELLRDKVLRGCIMAHNKLDPVGRSRRVRGGLTAAPATLAGAQLGASARGGGDRRLCCVGGEEGAGRCCCSAGRGGSAARARGPGGSRRRGAGERCSDGGAQRDRRPGAGAPPAVWPLPLALGPSLGRLQ